MQTIMITAHSGCEGTPDNSLLSIQAAIDLGADCTEVDVRLDAAGIPRLTHDSLADCSATIPLEDAFRLIRSSALSINCDLKEYAALYPTLRLAEQLAISRERLIFSGSVDIRLLLDDPGIAQRAQIYLNSEELCRFMAPELPQERDRQTEFLLEHKAEVAQLMQQLNVVCLNAPYLHMPHSAMAALRSAGVALSLWTVNDPNHQTLLLQEDLLNLTTRNVRSALQLRTSARKESRL